MPTAIELATKLHEKFKDVISAPTEFRGEANLVLKDASHLVEVMRYAKEALGFDSLSDITSIDHLGSEPRFELVYHLYSFASHQPLRIKTFTGEEKSEVASLVSLWAGADWHEREIFDMMGLRFKGHPDLRRILMWDSYPHHPLRKEFPLSGLPVDEVVKQAPMAGGPFVTSPGEKTTVDREPRGKGETFSKV